MALVHGPKFGKLEDISKGINGEVLRDYQVDEEIPWRFGVPNYERVNKAYMEGRTKKHAAGSLEEVVQKIVKNWEVESHHIADIGLWKTMDVEKFKTSTNGGPNHSAQHMCDVGPYNLLLGETPGYSAQQHDFTQANDVFKGTFTEGFAFEVLEVFSGPPNVSFTWRHFGRMTGPYKGAAPTGKMVELIGHTVARVNSDLVIEELHTHYDPQQMLKQLCENDPSVLTSCPHASKQ